MSQTSAQANTGTVVTIQLRPRRGDPMTFHDSAEAVVGRGLIGDSYVDKEERSDHREVTLIEREQVAAYNEAFDQDLTLEQTRRNLVTESVRLNDLVGKTFTVGEVVLEGIKLCEPCAHLERLTGQPVLKGLAGRGGLRAKIVTGGEIKVGDVIQEA